MSLINWIISIFNREPTVVISAVAGAVVAVLNLVGLSVDVATVTSVIVAVLAVFGIRAQVTPA